MATRRPMLPGLSRAQREIMEIVWQRGEVSAAEVRAILARKRELAKNTVRTLLERMEEKGWLRHLEEGRSYLYSAAQPREASIGQKVLEVVEQVCGGSPEQLVTALVDYRGLSAAELQRIRAVLDEARAQRSTAEEGRMIDTLATWYPGQRLLASFVLVAVTVTLLSASAWSGAHFLGRRAALCHGVLLAALAACLASPCFALGFLASGRSLLNVPLLATEDASSSALPLADEGRTTAAVSGATGDENLRESLRPAMPEPPPQPQVATAANLSMAKLPAPFRAAVVAGMLIWLGGVLVGLLGLFRSVRFLVHLRRSVQPFDDVTTKSVFHEAVARLGLRTPPAVGVSPLARSPLVVGWFRPIVVLPAALLRSLAASQLCDVFVHELAHIERRDHLIVLLQAMARSLFWPIPFVHGLNRQLERAREEVCDNHVLACRDAVSYGETLLHVAQLAWDGALSAGAVGILRWRGKLEDRILGLMDQGRNKMTRTPALVAGAVLLLFLSASALLCGTALVTAAQADQPPAAAEKSSTQKESRLTPAQEKALEKALAALGNVYALKAEEAVKCFAPPFLKERAAYEDATFPQIPQASQSLEGYFWVMFTWNNGLKYKSAHVHSAPAGLGLRLLDVLTGLLDCFEQDIESKDRNLLTKGIAADFVVRQQAPPQQIADQLAGILKDKFHVQVKITIQEAEREVFVLRGKYRSPGGETPEKIYGHQIIDSEEGGGDTGSFRQMLGQVGDWIESRIVSEVEDAPRQVSWHYNWRAPYTRELLAQDKNPQAVMRHLCKQTGLTVSKEKRRVRIISVEASK